MIAQYKKHAFNCELYSNWQVNILSLSLSLSLSLFVCCCFFIELAESSGAVHWQQSNFERPGGVPSQGKLVSFTLYRLLYIDKL